MKKQLLLIIALSFFIKVLPQNESFTGSWLLYKITDNNKTAMPYYPVIFSSEGKMLINGRELASWKTDNKTITFTSDIKDLSGKAKLIRVNQSELIYQKDKQTFYYKKYDPEAVKNDETYQKLLGVWKMSGEAITLNKLDGSGNFTQLVIDNGGTITSKAQYLYVPGEKTIVVQGDVEVLRGASKILNINAEYMELEQNDIQYQLEKIPLINQVEHLGFTYEDIEENLSEPTELPWNNENLFENLSQTKKIYYRRATYYQEVSAFVYSDILSEPVIDESNDKITLVNYLVKDEEPVKESETVKAGLYNSYNLFFPQKELEIFRVVNKNEQMEIDGVRYLCTVVEGMDGDTKIKFWMINDKPGIFAKIIKDNNNEFGISFYQKMELISIEK